MDPVAAVEWSMKNPGAAALAGVGAIANVFAHDERARQLAAAAPPQPQPTSTPLTQTPTPGYANSSREQYEKKVNEGYKSMDSLLAERQPTTTPLTQPVPDYENLQLHEAYQRITSLVAERARRLQRDAYISGFNTGCTQESRNKACDEMSKEKPFTKFELEALRRHDSRNPPSYTSIIDAAEADAVAAEEAVKVAILKAEAARANAQAVRAREEAAEVKRREEEQKQREAAEAEQRRREAAELARLESLRIAELARAEALRVSEAAKAAEAQRKREAEEAAALRRRTIEAAVRADRDVQAAEAEAVAAETAAKRAEVEANSAIRSFTPLRAELNKMTQEVNSANIFFNSNPYSLEAAERVKAAQQKCNTARNAVATAEATAPAKLAAQKKAAEARAAAVKIAQEKMLAMLDVDLEDLSSEVIYSGQAQDDTNRRKNVPKKIRDKVWSNEFGTSPEGYCVCCKEVINTYTWECAHIVAHDCGGLEEESNLRPTCRSCNRSMGTENLWAFKARCYPQVL
jgi:hypothetical protein